MSDVSVNQLDLARLQQRLKRLWDTSVSEPNQGNQIRRISLQDDDRIGGFNSISQHAEEIFTELSTEQQFIAEALFRCLTEGDRRRPARLWEIAAVAGVASAEVAVVIEAFRSRGRGFLMPLESDSLSNESIIDIAHESIVRNWSRLRGWAEQEAESVERYRRLLSAARRWRSWEWKEEALLAHPDNENAVEWLEREKPTAVWAERYGGDFELVMKFLEVSRAHVGSGQDGSFAAQTDPAAQGGKAEFKHLYHVSFARKDRDGDLDRFLELLEEEVAAKSRDRRDRITSPGLDIQTGEDWSASFAKILEDSAVLVSIITPNYIESDRTGRELEFFLRRNADRHKGVSALVPILWRPIRGNIPQVLRDLQVDFPNAPKTYLKDGLGFLIEQGGEDLKRMVSVLAEQIVTIAAMTHEHSTPGELPFIPEKLPSAWQRRAPKQPGSQRKRKIKK